MKPLILTCLICLCSAPALSAQISEQEKEIHALIADYATARETKDEALLNRILTIDVDQLTSSGSWRHGRQDSMDGMRRSSQNNPGKRTLTVDKVRFLNAEIALADARYQIESPDGATRKMWSTFVVIRQDSLWKIAAIRNMLPSSQQ